jgi:hypothetical protein
MKPAVSQNLSTVASPKRPRHFQVCLLAALLASTVLGNLRTAGCDLCAAFYAKDKSGRDVRGFFAGLAEQYTRLDTLQQDGQEIPSGGQFIDSSFTQVFAGYDFHKRFEAQLILPVIYRSYGYGSQHGSDFGIGDMAVLGKVLLFEKVGDHYSVTWNGLAGVKFPTGNTSHLNPAEPEFAPGIGGHDLALGSGSYDGLFGTEVQTHWNRFFLLAAAQYGLRTEGAYGYQYANDWWWSGGPGVRILQKPKYTLAIQAVVSGESKGEDTQRGAANHHTDEGDDHEHMPSEHLDDTATTSVFLGPQVSFAWADRLSAELGADLPVSIENSGLQVVPTFRIRAAVTWRF